MEKIKNKLRELQVCNQILDIYIENDNLYADVQVRTISGNESLQTTFVVENDTNLTQEQYNEIFFEFMIENENKEQTELQEIKMLVMSLRPKTWEIEEFGGLLTVKLDETILTHKGETNIQYCCDWSEKLEKEITKQLEILIGK